MTSMLPPPIAAFPLHRVLDDVQYRCHGTQAADGVQPATLSPYAEAHLEDRTAERLPATGLVDTRMPHGEVSKLGHRVVGVVREAHQRWMTSCGRDPATHWYPLLSLPVPRTSVVRPQLADTMPRILTSCLYPISITVAPYLRVTARSLY